MKPCLVISSGDRELIMAQMQSYPFVELRLDLLNLSDEVLNSVIKNDVFTIATIRKNIENQDFSQLKLAINNGIKAVDIGEDFSDEEVKEIEILASEKQVKIIRSYHNFERFPEDYDLIKIIDEYQNSGADWVKIAVKISTIDEALFLFDLYRNYKNLIAFGLGKWARFTRIASYELGAPFVYVSEDSSLAEGILTPKMVEEYNRN